MQERLRKIGGRLEVTSSKQGTMLTASVRLSSELAQIKIADGRTRLIDGERLRSQTRVSRAKRHRSIVPFSL
jgi:hypothetical protein